MSAFPKIAHALRGPERPRDAVLVTLSFAVIIADLLVIFGVVA